MNIRIKAAALLSVLVCSLTAGCAGGSSSEENSSAASTAAETTAAPTAEKTTEGTTASSNFDFDEKVKSVSLCGDEISYSVSINDLGDDFTIDTEYTEVMTNKYCVSLNYEGRYIGLAVYKTDAPDRIGRDTKLAGVSISTKKFADFDEPLITVNGIGLGDTREKVKDEFGACPQEMESMDYYMERIEAEREVCFSYASPEYNVISGIDITWN